MSMGEMEVVREGRRVLRKLAEGKRLAMCDADRYAITKLGMRKNAVKVERETVEAFLSRGWLNGSREDGYGLSDAGLCWLKRVEDETGSPFLEQHRLTSRRLIVDPQGIEREVEINDAESPIAWLRHRKLIDAMQHEAGQRLRRDYTLAQLQPRLGVDLEAPVVLGGDGIKSTDLSETVVAAKQRFSHAMKAVGPGLSDLLFDVCCHLTRLEGLEQRYGWPQRSAKVVLQIALNRLGEHYGLCIAAPRHGPMRAWQAQAAAQ